MTDDEHAIKLARIEWLMSCDPPADSKDGQELQALADEVQAYEEARWPITPEEHRPMSILLSNMDEAVLRMPFELAMSGELARRQFYDRVQALLDRIKPR